MGCLVAQPVHDQESNMSRYITEIQVSLNEYEEMNFIKQGLTKIVVNLNKGTRGNYIYLWYRKGDSSPITRIQCSFDDRTSRGLYKAGYHKIEKDLNKGTFGSDVFLWYYKGTTEYDIPIVDLCISTESDEEVKNMSTGWERLVCDLNRRTGGKYIYLWLKRERTTYIKEIIATNHYDVDGEHFNNGYIRLDEDVNRGAGRKDIFIWYRSTTIPAEAITDLQISTDCVSYTTCKGNSYQLVDMDLNEGSGRLYIYIWYKKNCCEAPIKTMTLLLNTSVVKSLERTGVTVINKYLNSSIMGVKMLLCFYQEEK